MQYEDCSKCPNNNDCSIKKYYEHYHKATKRVKENRDKEFFNKFMKVLSNDYIPMFAGRPVRDTIINQEDIENLLIDLNINKDSNIFINRS